MAYSFFGNVVYEILENGNILNGVYTNTTGLLNGEYIFDSEVATKEQTDDKGIEGRYICKFTQSNDPCPMVICILTITKSGNAYDFVWSNDINPDCKDKSDFAKGLGIKVGNNHISVAYSNKHK